jgi:hypothetical protein
MKNNKSYLLVSESFGVGQIIEIHTVENFARKRIQRFFDLQYNQIDPSVDINTEYRSLRNYRYQEDTFFENSQLVLFMQSNGFNSVYIIQIELDRDIDEIINDFILLRNA